MNGNAKPKLNGSAKKVNYSVPQQKMQGSNNAYMLVYTSAKALAEIRKSTNNDCKMETPPSKKAKKNSVVK